MRESQIKVWLLDRIILFSFFSNLLIIDNTGKAVHETNSASLPARSIFDKISVFTPYTKSINDSVLNYFKKENITVNELTYFDIESDLDIGKVDEKYLFEVLSKIDLEDSEALFVSCTALPVLSIIDKLEKKLNKVVLSSNQTLIWDSLNAINYKEKIDGFGKLFNS